MLAGVLAGLGAWVVSALSRPATAEGNDPNDVLLGGGNSATTLTFIDNNSGNATGVFQAQTNGSGTALYGSSNSGGGLVAVSSSSIGVFGVSTSSYAVYGESGSGIGTRGSSQTNIGLFGLSNASNMPGAAGRSGGGSTGVIGASGPSLPAAKAKTGVYGYAAQDSGALGVLGESPAGRAIQGNTTSGYAGYFAGKVYTTKWYELTEISTPAKPSANRVRLFVRESSGKTQLCAKFANGTVRVIATM